LDDNENHHHNNNNNYFAYGSNMSTARLQERIPEACPLGRARIHGVRLDFNKVGVDGSGKANLSPYANAIAWGVLFAVRTEDWLVLDRFEPGYERQHCELTLDSGEAIRAQVYLGIGRLTPTPPHDWYREHLLTGAREHGLPEDVIVEINRLQSNRSE
jgi:gamma-glutamylcyclotransferase